MNRFDTVCRIHAWRYRINLTLVVLSLKRMLYPARSLPFSFPAGSICEHINLSESGLGPWNQIYLNSSLKASQSLLLKVCMA